MARFVVRYRGSGPRPEEAIVTLRHKPSARILEDAGRTLLVDGDEADVRSAFADEASWLVAPETTTPAPDPRRRVERAPE